MTLTINGEEKSFAAHLNVAELIQQLGMKPDRVAVELNREIVSRSAWPATQLKEGDRLEIVHFVGGGLFSLYSEEQSDEEPLPANTLLRSLRSGFFLNRSSRRFNRLPQAFHCPGNFFFRDHRRRRD